MEYAAVMGSYIYGAGKPADWKVSVGIILLIGINAAISFIEENNSKNAMAELMASISQKT